MSDYIKRKSIRNLYSCLNPEDKVRVAQVLIDIDAIPPAEVVPKGSDEASLAYAEGWENGEEAERSRHKMNATGDLIERDKAINILDRIDVDIIPYADTREFVQSAIDYIRKELEELPSARPKGEWIGRSDGGRILHPWWESYECNQCGYEGSGAWNFCPNCGSDNREREGE